MREYYVDEGKLIVVDVCGRVCWPVRASAPCTRVYRPILMIVARRRYSKRRGATNFISSRVWSEPTLFETCCNFSPPAETL